MEDAIARMRQMTLHSHHIIQPLDTDPNYTSDIGSRPSYNINWNKQRSY